jgi:HD-like signal output (HDOD) protein
MSLFPPPNIEKLRAGRKTRKLIKILLHYKSYDLRREAASALGIIGDPIAIEPLIATLNLYGIRLKIVVLEALGELKAVSALPHIVKFLQSEDVELQVAALNALGNIASASTLEPLKTFLNSPSQILKISAIKAIGNIEDESALNTLVKQFWNENEDCRIVIIEALKNLRLPATPKYLMEFYKSGSIPVREAAAKILTHRGWKPDSQADDAWVTKREDKIAFNIPVKIQELIDGKGDLPAIPEIVLKLNAKLIDPDCAMRDIGDLVYTDPTLAARVVKVANSSYYARGEAKITDIQTAVVRLGLLQLRNIIYAFSILKQFAFAKAVDSRRFWKHCFVTAQIAKSISKALKLSEEEQERAYIAGLMHDIGILVMLYILPTQYERLLSIIKQRGLSTAGSHLTKVEENTFGAHHPSIGGAYVYRWWPVDDSISKAIVQHHGDLDDKTIPLLSRIIILANRQSLSMGYDNGLGLVSEPKALEESAFSAVGLNVEKTAVFLNAVANDIEAAEGMLVDS